MTGERLGNVFIWLTTGQVGKRLGYSAETIRVMCEDGKLEGAHRRPGGQWRIPQHTVDAYLGVIRRPKRQNDQERQNDQA